MKTQNPELPILSERLKGVMKIRLNRLEKRNAMSLEMYRLLAESLLEADEDPDIRAILICGDNSVFTSGKDLNDFKKVNPDSRPEEPGIMLKALNEAKKPIVAAVSGPALGLGTTLLLHCDLVYASDTATFRLPFVNVGLCPEAGSSYLLPKLTGYHQAAELLFLGEPFGAEKAKEIGLVNEIWPAADLLNKVQLIMEKLVNQPPGALATTKQLLKKTSVKIVAETMTDEFIHLDRQLLSEEGKRIFAGKKEK